MDALIDAVPGGWLGMVLVLLLLGPPTLLSSFATKLPGVLGLAARKWQGRQVSAVQRGQAFEKTIEDAVERRVRIRLEEFDHLEKDWVNVRDDFRTDIEELKADREVAYEYIAYVARWRRITAIQSSEHGWGLMPFIGFEEFRDKHFGKDAT